MKHNCLFRKNLFANIEPALIQSLKPGTKNHDSVIKEFEALGTFRVTVNRMVDSSSPSSSPHFLTKHWEGFKEFWGERFSFLDHYSKFIKRDKPLPSWSDADVEAFIASDPIHVPALKTAREAAKFAATGSVIGAVSTAGITWKYSRSLHGSGLAFLAGGVFGWTFGQEIANHSLQLYRFDTLAAQTKFLEWWESKSERQS